MGCHMRFWRRSLGSGRPILTLVLGGIIGGSVAALYSMDALRSEPSFNWVSLSAPSFGVLFIAVGVLLGVVRGACPCRVDSGGYWVSPLRHREQA